MTIAIAKRKNPDITQFQGLACPLVISTNSADIRGRMRLAGKSCMEIKTGYETKMVKELNEEKRKIFEHPKKNSVPSLCRYTG